MLFIVRHESNVIRVSLIRKNVMDVMRLYIKTVVVEMNNAFDYDHARKIFKITGKYDASRLCPQKLTATAENANSMHKIKESRSILLFSLPIQQREPIVRKLSRRQYQHNVKSTIEDKFWIYAYMYTRMFS